MKKKKIEFRCGKFTDYTGAIRDYVIAVVSELLPNCGTVETECGKYDIDIDYHVVEICSDRHVSKVNKVIKKLSIGFAVCNPMDTFNVELGKEIALGKAEKRPSGVLYATEAGMINTNVVDALISQEMAHFEANPGAVIAGYNKARDKYLAEHAN